MERFFTLTAYDLKAWENTRSLSEAIKAICEHGNLSVLSHFPQGPEDDAVVVKGTDVDSTIVKRWEQSLSSYENEENEDFPRARIGIHFRNTCLYDITKENHVSERAVTAVATEWRDDFRSISMWVNIGTRVGERAIDTDACAPQIAEDFVRVGRYLAEALSPRFLCILEEGERGKSIRPAPDEIRANELESLYWANFISPELISLKSLFEVKSISNVIIEKFGDGIWLQLSRDFYLENGEREQIEDQVLKHLDNVGIQNIYWRATGIKN